MHIRFARFFFHSNFAPIAEHNLIFLKAHYYFVSIVFDKINVILITISWPRQDDLLLRFKACLYVLNFRSFLFFILVGDLDEQRYSRCFRIVRYSFWLAKLIELLCFLLPRAQSDCQANQAKLWIQQIFDFNQWNQMDKLFPAMFCIKILGFLLEKGGFEILYPEQNKGHMHTMILWNTECWRVISLFTAFMWANFFKILFCLACMQSFHLVCSFCFLFFSPEYSDAWQLKSTWIEWSHRELWTGRYIFIIAWLASFSLYRIFFSFVSVFPSCSNIYVLSLAILNLL